MSDTELDPDNTRSLQDALRRLGFYDGMVDGDHGAVTAGAVAAYLEWRGYDPTSPVDGALLAAAHADAHEYEAGTEQADVDAYGGDPGAADPNAGVRAAVVAAARGEIGLVRAKDSGGAGDDGRDVRYGWERLLEYFQTAAPGVWPDDDVKHLGEPLPSWCGIFALWALKTGGASVGTWAIGVGIPGTRVVRDPLPGDIGYIHENQHHCIIAEVDGDTIVSIDGNTVGDDTGGGEVNDRTRHRSAYGGFLSVFD